MLQETSASTASSFGLPADFLLVLSNVIPERLPFPRGRTFEAGGASARYQASIAHFGERTEIVPAPCANSGQRTRIDLRWLLTIADSVVRSAKLSLLRLRTNPLAFPIHEQWSVVVTDFRGSRRSVEHRVVVADRIDYLDAVLFAARAGAPAGALIDEAEKFTDSRFEAEQFIQNLVENRFLVLDDGPALLGTDPLEQLRRCLADASPTMAMALGTLIEWLANAEQQRAGKTTARRRAIANILRRATGVCVPPSAVVSSALASPMQGVVSNDVRDLLARGAMLLARIGRCPSGQLDLDAFMQAFSDRYGTRQVPMLEALDPRRGVAFDANVSALDEASLLSEGDLTRKTPRPPPQMVAEDEALLAIAERAWTSGAYEVVLSEDALRPLCAPAALAWHGPSSLRAKLLPAAFDPESEQPAILVEDLVGPLRPELLECLSSVEREDAECVMKYLDRTAQVDPNVIVVDFVHIPHAMQGAMTARPSLQTCTLHGVGSNASVSGMRLDELVVALEERRLVLRRQCDGRRVLVRMPSQSAPHPEEWVVVRFLHALQRRELGFARAWSWGPLERASFLPRIRDGRIILSPARWCLASAELSEIRGTTGRRRLARLRDLRRARRLPRHVRICDEAGDVDVDLGSVVGADMLVGALRGRSVILLCEQFPGPEKRSAAGARNPFPLSVILPFLPRVSEQRHGRTPATVSASAVAERGVCHVSCASRSFLPGSEWLYFKLYAASVDANRLINEVAKPLICDVVRDGIVDRWFFLKYADPHWHVRVRLRGDPILLLERVLPRLHAVVAGHSAWIWKMQIDTYEREVERYGGILGIDLAEQTFHADSEAVLNLLGLLAGDDDPDRAWRVAMMGMDWLLADLGLDARAKLDVVSHARRELAQELGVTSRVIAQIDAKYEREAARSTCSDGTEKNPYVEALSLRSERLRPVGTGLGASSIGITRQSFGRHMIHMHANRLLQAPSRAQELVIARMLERLYGSDEVRETGGRHVMSC